MDYSSIDDAETIADNVLLDKIGQAALTRDAYLAEKHAQERCAEIRTVDGKDEDRSLTLAIEQNAKKAAEQDVIVQKLLPKVMADVDLDKLTETATNDNIAAIEREHAKQVALAGIHDALGEDDQRDIALIQSMLLEGVHEALTQG